MAEREHDVVVYGATGFTGALTAEYLARHAPAGTRWAIAGRSEEKLKQTLDRLGVDVPTVRADATDPASLAAMAASAKVVITTVGPYIQHGEPLVAACAEHGTAYLDLTGEPEFMHDMYVRHHRRAAETGARILHACGFDAIPQDLGVHFTIRELDAGDAPVKVEAFVRVAGNPSGGTVASAMLIMGRMRQGMQAERRRRGLEPQTSRRVRIALGRPHHEDAVDSWLLPMPTIDPQIVRASALALDYYGPDFSYSPYIAVKKLPVAVGLAAGAGAMTGLAMIPPVRKLVSSRIPQGTGPTKEQREKSWFKVRFRGVAEGGTAVETEVSGGDPGYTETSKMLAEGALCLALDDGLPDVAGQVTTASAMGDALTARLQRAGIGFAVLP